MSTHDYFLLASILFFVAGICYAFFMKFVKKDNYEKYGICLFATTTLALIPIYLLRNYQDNVWTFKVIFASMLDTLHAMTGKHLHDATKIGINSDICLQHFYPLYISFLHIFVLLLIARSVFVIFQDFFSRIYFSLFERNKLCIFCNVSDQTLTLAENIRNIEKSHKDKHALIFINIKRKEISAEYLEKLQNLNAYIFSFSLHDLVLKRRFLRKAINIFIFELDDIKNVHTMLTFIKNSENKNSAHKDNFKLETQQNSNALATRLQKHGIYIHVLSACHETEIILDSIEADNLTFDLKYGKYDWLRDLLLPPEHDDDSINGIQNNAAPKHLKPSSIIKIPICLRLVRENRSTFYNLFNTKPLFMGIRGDELVILVVGGGINGREAVKIASWCGQVLNTKLKIILVDGDILAKNRLRRDCPELYVIDGDKQNEINANKTPLPSALRFSKEECTVYFYHRHVEESGFVDVLKKHNNIGYAICTLGNDQLNLRAAMNIRSVFEHHVVKPYQKRPFIAALLNDSLLVENGHKLKFDIRVNCWIHTFGGLKEIYSWDNIVSPYLHELGKYVNRYYSTLKINEDKKQQKEYEADESYEKKEYFRSSSIASGMHIKYKIYAALCQNEGRRFFLETWNGNLPEHLIESMEKYLRSVKDIDDLAKLEHRRWDTYTRSIGWRSVDLENMNNYKPVIGNYRHFASKLQPCITPWENLPSIDKDLQGIDRGLVQQSVNILRKARQSADLLDAKAPLLPTVGITGRTTLGMKPNPDYPDDRKKDTPICQKLVKTLLQAIRDLHDSIVLKNSHCFPINPELRLCSCLALGADRVVAKEALDLNYMLDVALPFPPHSTIHADYVVDEDEKQKSDDELYNLLYKARDVLVFGEAVEKAASQKGEAAKALRQNVYIEATRAMLDHCNVLIVLWDGEEDNRPGSTHDNMKKALKENKLVFYIRSDAPKQNNGGSSKDWSIVQAKINGHDGNKFFKVDNIEDVWQKYLAYLGKQKSV